jgi:hypothetical protein
MLSKRIGARRPYYSHDDDNRDGAIRGGTRLDANGR